MIHNFLCRFCKKFKSVGHPIKVPGGYKEVWICADCARDRDIHSIKRMKT